MGDRGGKKPSDKTNNCDGVALVLTGMDSGSEPGESTDVNRAIEPLSGTRYAVMLHHTAPLQVYRYQVFAPKKAQPTSNGEVWTERDGYVLVLPTCQNQADADDRPHR